MEHPTYEEGRLAAIAVRLALSSGLPTTSAKAALELACRMIEDQQAAPQNSEPCRSSVPRGRPLGRVGLGGGLKRDVSSSNRL
ncbi:hypothetical protein SAMN05216321_12226 [Cupriavidus sp. OV038]|nr:hypothetical protein SAMN05216321_12226 [Cupriavidus sp. OV038]SFQ17420.1 hypothetical protein SAMN05216322_12215 [Cupriavidus sp. OV096]